MQQRECWEVELPEDLDQELGAVLMSLSFFASRNLEEAFHAESEKPDSPPRRSAEI